MAAKSKKRQFRIENKLLKLDKLTLEDVICSICQSILIEPVILPCFHDFCKFCFNGSIENNALCCPLCRLRIGSWLRTATKQNNLVNKKLWEFIKSKFQKEIDTKSRGEDIRVSNGDPAPRLSEPGEIRLEYETELNRLRTERLHLEQQHLHETEILVQQIQNEEEESNRSYIERLKEDELLAREIQENHFQDTQTTIVKFNNNVSKLKKSKIDSFFIKKAAANFKE